MRPQTSKRDIDDFFLAQAASHQALETVPFGEFLASRGVISRRQLLAALQLQDRSPGVRIGECLAKLGVLTYEHVELYLRDWQELSVVEA